MEEGEGKRPRVASTPSLHPDRLTIVLTTSPIKTHPSTRLIEEVFESIAVLAGLGECRKIIVADGVKVRERDKFRSGICTPEAMSNYRHYLSRLEALTKTEGSPLRAAEALLALDSARLRARLRQGLMRVATPFVLVAQHDRSFVRPVEVSHVLDVMETANADTVCTTSGRVNYVGFPTTTTLSHGSYVASKYGLAVEPVTRDVPDPKVDGSNPGRGLMITTRRTTSARARSGCSPWSSSTTACTSRPRGGTCPGCLAGRGREPTEGGLHRGYPGSAHAENDPGGVCRTEDVGRGRRRARAHAAFGTFVYQDDSEGDQVRPHRRARHVLTAGGSCRKYGLDTRTRPRSAGGRSRADGSRALGRGDVRDRDGVQGRSGVRRVERGRQRLAS